MMDPTSFQAFEIPKPPIPYVPDLVLAIVPHHPPLPESKPFATSQSTTERLTLSPLERCFTNLPAESISFPTSSIPVAPRESSTSIKTSTTDYVVDPPVTTSKRSIITNFADLPALKETAQHHNMTVGTPQQHLTSLKITSHLRVRDGANTQVVLASSTQGVPGTSNLPFGATEIVVKLYDPLYADHRTCSNYDPFLATDQDYRTEVAAYNRLQPIQGNMIPRFYGSYTVDLPVDKGFLPATFQLPPKLDTTKVKRKNDKQKSLQPDTDTALTRPVRLILLQYIENAEHLYAIKYPKMLRVPRRRLILSSILTAWETMYFTYGVYYRALHPINILRAEGLGEGSDLLTPKKKKRAPDGVPRTSGIIILDLTNVSLRPGEPLWRHVRDESWWDEFFHDWKYLWNDDWSWEEWMQSRYGDVDLADRRIGTWVPSQHGCNETGSIQRTGDINITKAGLRGQSSRGRGRGSKGDMGTLSYTLRSEEASPAPSTSFTENEHEFDTPSKAERPSQGRGHGALRYGGLAVPGSISAARQGQRPRRNTTNSSQVAEKGWKATGMEVDDMLIAAANKADRSDDEDYEDAEDDEDDAGEDGDAE